MAKIIFVTKISFIALIFVYSFSSFSQRNIVFSTDTSKLYSIIGRWELRDSLPDGEWRAYRSKNKKPLLVKGQYKNSVKEGLFSYYDYNGKIIERIEYSRGIRHGLFIHYSNGFIQCEGFYYNGKKSGLWIFKDEDWLIDTNANNPYKLNGYIKTSEAYYNNDTLIQAIDYYKNGRPRKIIDYDTKSTLILSINYYYESSYLSFSVKLKLGRLEEWSKWFESGQIGIEAKGEFDVSYGYLAEHIISNPSKYKPKNGTITIWSENGGILDQQQYQE